MPDATSNPEDVVPVDDGGMYLQLRHRTATGVRSLCDLEFDVQFLLLFVCVISIYLDFSPQVNKHPFIISVI